MSRLMARLEEAGCVVERVGEDRLDVLMPGWDAAIFPFEGILSAQPLQRLLWDRMRVAIDEQGVARYRMVYWAGVQPFLHFALAAAFAFEVWFGAGAQIEAGRFLAAFALANLAAWGVSAASFSMSRRALLSPAACRERA